jgi:hypothetical protein
MNELTVYRPFRARKYSLDCKRRMVLGLEDGADLLGGWSEVGGGGGGEGADFDFMHYSRRQMPQSQEINFSLSPAAICLLLKEGQHYKAAHHSLSDM